MSITTRHIVHPTEKDIEACTEILHEAFDRKYFYSSLGNNEALVKPCIRAHLMSGVIGGEIHVAELPDVGIIGVAMWFGPGQKFFSEPEHCAAGWNQLMNEMGEVCNEWWTYFLKTMDDKPEEYYGTGVQLDSYHLQLLGIHPDYQKKGAGNALFSFVEPRATAESKSIVLETVGESAVSFYRHLGYKVFGPDNLKVAGSETNVIPAYWFQKRF